MKKRIMSIILTLIMLLGMLPAAVFAADGDSGAETYAAGSYAERVYQNTTYFNHVDIRVRGTYTTGTTVDLTTYNIRLGNPRISVVNPDGYSRYNFTRSFTNSTSYEWRATGVRVYKGAAVTLTCDIYNAATNQLLLKDYTHTFYDGWHNGVNYGNTEFVKAIEQCDGKQGLDFIVNPEDIIEAVYYGVEYRWTVEDADTALAADLQAKLDAIADPPVYADTYLAGDVHTLDSLWKEGTHFILESGGEYYQIHFEGWDSYSDGDTEKTALPAGGSLTIDSDTVVYGRWVVEAFEHASPAYMLITKTFAGEIKLEDLTDEDLKGHWFTVTAPNEVSYDVEFTQMTRKDGKLEYLFPLVGDGTYTVTEHNAVIPGYTETTSVTGEAIYVCDDTVADDGSTLPGTDGLVGGSYEFGAAPTAAAASAAIDLPEEVEEVDGVTMGSVDFTNTYAKAVGDAIHHYPTLHVNKLDAEDHTALEGAVFELRRAVGQGAEIVEGTTDASGYAVFANIQAGGPYVLEEVTAPEGYAANGLQYMFYVAIREGYPVEVLQDGKWCQVYEYDIVDMQVTEADKDQWADCTDFSVGTTGTRNRLAVYDKKITGELTVTKDFAGVDKAHLPASVAVAVTGPGEYEETVILTGEDGWTVKLTGLEPGSYTVEEQAVSVTGYEQVSVTYNGETSGVIELDPAEPEGGFDPSNPVVTAEVVIVNTYEPIEGDVHLLPSLEILKLRDSGGTVLEGAVFQLTGTDSDYSAALRTDSSGKAVTEALPEGVYTLQETAAPDGYKLYDTVYTVKVEHESASDPVLTDGVFVTTHTYTLTVTDENGNVLAGFDGDLDRFTVYNTKNEGEITVIKTFGVNNAYVPDSIEVTLYRNGETVDTATLSVENNWTHTFTGLALGTYVVKESEEAVNVDGKPMYAEGTVSEVEVLLSSEVVNGADMSLANVELQNTYTEKVVNPAEFTVKKVDEAGNVISAPAVFTLYSDKDCTEVVAEKTTANGTALFHGFTEAGTYYLKETEAPENYRLSDTVWKVTVSLKNGEAEVKVNNGVWETIFNWIAGVEGSSWADGVLSVPNEKLLGDLAVTKTVEDELEQYSDAEYTVTVDFSDDAFDTVLTLAAGETAVIEDIPYGTAYTVSEDHTDAAFVGSIENGTGTVSAESTAVTVTNVYTYTEYAPGVSILKLDADTAAPVAGAGFTLFADAECSQAVGEEAFADEIGMVKLPVTEAGTYYLRETTVPEGYYGVDTVFTVTVTETFAVKNAGTEDAVTQRQVSARIADVESSTEDRIMYRHVIENTAIKPVVISVEKEWVLNGGEQPESVEVTLYRNGEAYETVELSEKNDWFHIWNEGLTDEYTWTVDETEVPEGYTKTVTHEEGAYTIVNTRERQPVQIIVNKLWVGKNVDHPDSIEVTLYRDGEAYETVTLSEENKWAWIWQVSDGYTWTVDEAKVPEGYTKTVVQDGMNFIITNTHEDIPDTGDDAALAQWLVMAVIGLAGLGFTAVLAAAGKKKADRR